MIMGDFNIHFLEYGHNTDSALFAYSLYTNFLLPYISIPSQVTTHSRSLIIFFQTILKKVLFQEIQSLLFQITMHNFYS